MIVVAAIVVRFGGMGRTAMRVVVMFDRIAARTARMSPKQRDEGCDDGAEQRQKDDCLNH